MNPPSPSRAALHEAGRALVMVAVGVPITRGTVVMNGGPLRSVEPMGPIPLDDSDLCAMALATVACSRAAVGGHLEGKPLEPCGQDAEALLASCRGEEWDFFAPRPEIALHLARDLIARHAAGLHSLATLLDAEPAASGDRLCRCAVGAGVMPRVALWRAGLTRGAFRLRAEIKYSRPPGGSWLRPKGEPEEWWEILIDRGYEALSDDTDECIAIAHEVGHLERIRAGIEDSRVRELEAQGRVRWMELPPGDTARIHAEERSAWHAARVCLEALAFDQWDRFDAQREQSLRTYVKVGSTYHAR